MVYKNVDDAVPLGLASSKRKANIDSKSVGKISAESEIKINGLLVAVDDCNNSLMFKFRMCYLMYQSDPCNQLKFFQDTLQQVICAHEQMQRTKIHIEGLISIAKNGGKSFSDASHAEFMSLYKAIVANLGNELPRESAVIEIEKSRIEAVNWIGGGHGS